MTQMRVGLFIPSVAPIATPEFLIAFAEAADDGGFASMWLGEHIVLFDEYQSQYPYSGDGKIGVPAESGMLDCYAALAFLARASTRGRIGTAVCLLPQRNPVATAKEVATVDWLSGGRLDVGIGVGWLREEFEALDASFDDRAGRCREYVEVMRTLWCDEVSSFEGDSYRLPACRMYPKPVQRPHPPLYFGGESNAALRRVADLGNGWHGFGHLPESAAERIRVLERLLVERGRSLAEVDVTVSPYLQPIGPELLSQYRDAGVDQLVLVAFAFDPAGIRDAIGRLSDDFAAPAAEL
jgi:probable F420-dependent oxidoreductase